MVRESLIAATLVALASPVVAQVTGTDEWTSNRPDGHAPIGMTGARPLAPGEMEVTYRLVQTYAKGVWFDEDSLGLAQTLADYPIAPLDLTNLTHHLSLSYGAGERLSVFADIGFSSRERTQTTSAGPATLSTVDELTDMELSALFKFIEDGLYVAHAQLGVLVPTGSSDPGTGNLPYDMRPGAGSFGFTPGLTVQTQNERGSVGAQAKARIYLGENSSNYRVGNGYEGTAWIGLRLNDYFSLSARLRTESYTRISGTGDADLLLISTQDPGNSATQGGSRSDVLVGMNFYIPESAYLGGNRLAIELMSPASRTYKSDQLGVISGLSIGWQMSF